MMIGKYIKKATLNKISEIHEKYYNKTIIIFLLIYTFVLRAPFVFSPFIGRHAWNEAIYSSVVLDMVKHNYWYPWRVQFHIPDFNLGPIWYWFAFISVKLLGNHEFAYRLPSLFSTVLSVVVIYLIIYKFSENTTLSFLTAFIFASFPLTVYYGSRAQLEAMMYLFFYLSLYFFFKFIKQKTIRDLAIAGLFFGVSFVTKSSILPFLIFFSIVLIIEYFLKDNDKLKNKISKFLKCLCVFLVFFILPIVFWQLIVNIIFWEYKPYLFFLKRVFGAKTHFQKTYKPFSYYASEYLINTLNMVFGFGIYFYFLSFGGILLIKRNNHLDTLMSLLLLVGLISIYNLRGHAITHEYYNYFIALPTAYFISLFFTIVISKLKTRTHRYKIHCEYLFLAILVLILFILSWHSAVEYWNSKDAYGTIASMETGKFIKSITDENSWIMAYGPVMGFYSERRFDFWGLVWIYNTTDLKQLTLRDILEGKTLYKHYRISTNNFSTFINVFEERDYDVVVITGFLVDYAIKKTSDTNYKNLFKYLERNYTKVKIIPPFIIYKSKKLNCILLKT